MKFKFKITIDRFMRWIMRIDFMRLNKGIRKFDDANTLQKTKVNISKTWKRISLNDGFESWTEGDHITGIEGTTLDGVITGETFKLG